MQYFYTQQDYQQYLYRTGLRKTVNSLGGLLLTFFGLEIILGMISGITVLFSGNNAADNALYLIENGMISTLIFFVAGLVYCLIRRSSLGALFPFQKVGARTLAMLCTIGIAFSLMSNYVVSLVNNAFGLFGITNNQGGLNTSEPMPVLLYYLTVAILPALAEEFAFRGVIMGTLKPYSRALALVVSSTAFALMHGNFVQLPFTFCCGLVFGYVDLITGSLLPSIIIHFLNNGLSVTFDILTSYKIVSTELANAGYGVIFAVTGVLAFLFIKKLSKERPEYFRFTDSDDVIPYREKLKTAAASPTMISYAVIMLLYCLVILISPALS